MRSARIAVAANRFAAPAISVLLVASLLAAIAFTRIDWVWIIFLVGVLAAALVAYVSRTGNARWVIARRTAQLHSARAKLAAELRLRVRAEESLARVRAGIEFIDENLPAMLAYVDTEGRVRYHNRSYAHWTGLEGDSIDGRRIEDIVGPAAYLEIEKPLADALKGRDIRYERTQNMPNGETCRLFVQYLPNYAEDGKVTGVFGILTDITRAADVGSAQPEGGSASGPMRTRLMSALEHDEFSLYWQAILPLRQGAREAPLYEVLLRMNEEENSLIPPGTFLPWAEEFGLLHEIDRWVVRHVLDFAAHAGKARRTYMINLSAPTIRDPGFAQFVRECLAARAISGDDICFELPEADALSDPAGYREFVRALDGTGCHFAVSGFGRNALSLRLLKQLGVEFLKLDGGIVLDILRNPAALSRVRAINRATRAAGMHIIAECVENDATRAALERIEIEFAQGFGIAKPRPMGDFDPADAGFQTPLPLEHAAA